MAVFGAAAGGVYGMAKLAESNMRLEQGAGGGRRHIRGGQIPRTGYGGGYGQQQRPHHQ